MIATKSMTDHDRGDRDLLDLEEVVVGLVLLGNLRRSPRSRLDMYDSKKLECSS